MAVSSDPNDVASEQEDAFRRSAMVTSKKPEGPAPTGACLYCGERLPKPMRWCDADCRDNWSEQHENRRT